MYDIYELDPANFLSAPGLEWHATLKMQYLDTKNLYGWAISQKLSVNGFKWEENMQKFNKDFIKSYDEDNDKGYIFEVDIKNPKSLHNFHGDLPFLADRVKIDKRNKFVCSLYDKNNYVFHIRALKWSLNHGLIFKKVHEVIEYNQEAWLKEYIDMNTKLNPWIILFLEKQWRI